MIVLPKMRDVIDQHGNVQRPPTDLRPTRADEVLAKVWNHYRDAHVAQPYNEEDPYAREVGGLE